MAAISIVDLLYILGGMIDEGRGVHRFYGGKQSMPSMPGAEDTGVPGAIFLQKSCADRRRSPGNRCRSPGLTHSNPASIVRGAVSIQMLRPWHVCCERVATDV